MLNRRQFLGCTAAVSALQTQSLLGQTPTSDVWGGPILDVHLHLREGRTTLGHIDGCGVNRAVLLPGLGFDAQARAEIAQSPKRFVRFVRADVTKPDAIANITKELRAGAIGIGEIKYHVALDSPEMHRVYDLAADFKVPITIHFQEVPHFDGEGVFNTGFERLGAVLKAYPKTTFIGHADAFWANVSAKVPASIAYPRGPITPGGLSDRWLGEFPNLYADMSANSCNSALNRDPDFMRAFLVRHQDKLLFGSDCACLDGRGKGNDPIIAPTLKGKCVARETLGFLKQHTSAEVFRKTTWDNASKLLRLVA